MAAQDGREGYMLLHPTGPSCERWHHDHTEHGLTHARLVHVSTLIVSFTEEPQKQGLLITHDTFNLLNLIVFQNCCH